MREQLRARSSAATWKPESKAGFANPGPNKVSQPEVILRRGRVFPIGEASSAPEKKSDQAGVTPRSVLRESQNVTPSAVRCLTCVRCYLSSLICSLAAMRDHGASGPRAPRYCITLNRNP